MLIHLKSKKRVIKIIFLLCSFMGTAHAAYAQQQTLRGGLKLNLPKKWVYSDLKLSEAHSMEILEYGRSGITVFYGTDIDLSKDAKKNHIKSMCQKFKTNYSQTLPKKSRSRFLKTHFQIKRMKHHKICLIKFKNKEKIRYYALFWDKLLRKKHKKSKNSAIYMIRTFVFHVPNKIFLKEKSFNSDKLVFSFLGGIQ